MIKITLKTIEVNSEEFIQELKQYCYDLKQYLQIHWLNKDLFNQHFKTNLTLLEFTKLMDDYGFKIQIFTTDKYEKLYLIDITKLLKSIK
jgi:hypothetical protein